MTGIEQQIDTTVRVTDLSGRTGKGTVFVQVTGAGGTGGIVIIPTIVVIGPLVNTGIIEGETISSAEDRCWSLHYGSGDRCLKDNCGVCDEWFCCR